MKTTHPIHINGKNKHVKLMEKNLIG